MSDLSSNSMSREEFIRAARAGCIRQIEGPGQTKEQMTLEEEQLHTPFSKGTYMRLFFTGVLFLGAFLLKYNDISLGVVSTKTIQATIESNKDFQDLQKDSGKLLEKKIIPVFHRLKDESLL